MSDTKGDAGNFGTNKNNNCGSEWNRWDLHIHAPTSAKNNQFSVVVNGREISGNEDEVWEEYINRLEKLPPEIKVLGITDYFSIDGYEKVKKCKDEGKLDNIDLLIPNLELRLSDLTNNNKQVNIHILYSPNCTIDEIKISLHQLKTSDDSPVATLKEEYIQENPLVSVESFKDYIKSQSDKIDFITAVSDSSNDGLSGLQGSKESTRREILKNVDFIFSPNDKTRKFHLGQHNDWTPEKYIQEFNSLKPCIHGSDAHYMDELCEPDGKRYCWIKANTTFDGLKQLLYNPEDRVRIGELCPDVPSEMNRIHRVKLSEQEDLFLNPNLNVIIGSRSSGKSFLLMRIADKINKEIVRGQFNKVGYENNNTYDRNKKEMERNPIGVYYGSHELSGERKILYIPQSFLNHLNHDSDEIQKIIKKYIDGNSSLSKKHNDLLERYNNKIAECERNIKTKVDEYEQTIQGIQVQEEELSKFASVEQFDEALNDLKTEIKNLRDEGSINDMELQEYEETQKEIISIRDTKEKEQTNLEMLEKQIQNLDDNSDIRNIKRVFRENLTDSNKVKIDEAISTFKTAIKEVFNNEMKAKKDEISKYAKNITDKQSEISSVSEKIEKNQKLHSKTETLKKLNEEKQKRENICNNIKNLKYNCDQILKNIKCLFEQYKSDTNEIVESVNELLVKDDKTFKIELKQHIDRSIPSGQAYLFKPSVRDRKEYVTDTGLININHLEKIIDKDNFDYKINYRDNRFYPEIKKFFKCPYIIRYDVTENGKSIISGMSIGQRSITMLKLMIEFSAEKYPVLIDQPEDDLDNYAIYNEMVQFIRAKKVERQFIVVTHNANVVLGADAENVIVCSYDGKEYRIDNDAIEVAKIREDICKLLEGGKEAFAKRERQYIEVKA